MIDALSERLQHDAQVFDDLLRLIPAKFYVMDKGDDANNSKFQHNKRKKAPKQAIKDATKKAKKAKLDPENAKSITQVQEEKAKQLKEESSDDDESDDQQDDEASVEDEKMDVDSGAFSGLDDQPAAEKVQEPGELKICSTLFSLFLI